ncbi:hypothetical protein T10_4275, partial [Trichinella papuae]
MRRVMCSRESCVRIHCREGFQTLSFSTLLYANKDDPLKIALSLVTVHLKKAKTLSTRNKTRTARSRTIEQKRMEQRKSENADDTKQITDGMKQNKRGNE